jgi:hypothetical protein
MEKVKRVEKQIESKRKLVQKIQREIKELEEMKTAFYFSVMSGKGIY